ncbi:MAG: amidohydrolase family protein [Rhodospirillales bacterium]
MTSLGAPRAHDHHGAPCAHDHDGCKHGASRRHFLAAVGGLGIASLMPATLASAQGAARIIDTHHHFYAPDYQKAWVEWNEKHKVPNFPTQMSWSPAKAIEEMDKGGVRTGILSVPSTPGLWFDAGAEAANRMARTCNEYGAGMVRDHKGRFGLFATLSMIDADASLKEIEYAFDTLKADGVGLQSSYGDKWLGHADYKPVFEELNRRGAVVYVHPLAAACCFNIPIGTGAATLEVPHDTTRTVSNLFLSGAFARYRNIKWLFSHAGGTIPMLAGRLDYFSKFRKDYKDLAPDGLEAELRRLYYDTANALHPASMAALMKLVPASQITYGSDYPYVPIAAQAQELQKVGFTPQELAGVESGNAIRLVPRLKA